MLCTNQVIISTITETERNFQLSLVHKKKNQEKIDKTESQESDNIPSFINLGFINNFHKIYQISDITGPENTSVNLFASNLWVQYLNSLCK